MEWTNQSTQNALSEIEKKKGYYWNIYWWFRLLVYEMLFIKQSSPSLNTLTDSICPKLFV